MILKLETERLSTLDEVRMFVAGSAAVDFAGLDRESTYEFTRRTLARFGYGRLGKADKGLLRRYLTKATGLSRAQVARLIAQHVATGRIVDRRGGAPSKPFARVYTAADARRLAEADELLGQLSGPATRAVMRREFEVFGDARVDFETLDAEARAESDLAAYRRVKEERERLFAAIGRAWPAVA